MSGKTLVTAAELADRLSVTRRTVYRMIHKGLIPRNRVGGQWRFDLNEVLKTLESNPGTRKPGTGKTDRKTRV